MTLPTVSDLLTPRGLADPYPIYAEFRSAAARGLDIGRVVVSHAEVSSLLGDRRLSSDRVEHILAPLTPDVDRTCPFVRRTLEGILAFRDPPDHTRLRRLLSSTFTPRMVGAQAAVTRRLAHRLLDEVADPPDFDLRQSLTFPLPALVIGSVLGIPEADLDRFKAWALDIVLIVGSGRPTAELARGAQAHFADMRAYLGDLVAHRRRQPADDLLSAMVQAADRDDRLSEDEIYANATFLMTAGHETATNMMSNGVAALLSHPDQLARLRAQPELVEGAVEECLRYESPVQMTPRFATADGDYAGRRLRAGDSLLLFVGAANRDPAAFTDPDRFDIGRSGPARHVAFGYGAHFCLGAALARVEMAAVLGVLLERFDELALGPGAISWQPTIDFRGPLTLPVVARTAGSADHAGPGGNPPGPEDDRRLGPPLGRPPPRGVGGPPRLDDGHLSPAVGPGAGHGVGAGRAGRRAGRPGGVVRPEPSRVPRPPLRLRPARRHPGPAQQPADRGRAPLPARRRRSRPGVGRRRVRRPAAPGRPMADRWSTSTSRRWPAGGRPQSRLRPLGCRTRRRC